MNAAYEKNSPDNLTAMVIEFAWNNMHASSDLNVGLEQEMSNPDGGSETKSHNAQDSQSVDDIDDMFED